MPCYQKRQSRERAEYLLYGSSMAAQVPVLKADDLAARRLFNFV